MAVLRKSMLLASVSALTAFTAIPTWAQDNSEALETVVVTGTLIRGTNPIGTNLVRNTAAEITATGAASSAQILQNITQLATFGSLQFPTMGGNSVTTNKPNLRGLPGFNSAGGTTTLVLLNGVRIVGMGVTSTAPDPDFVPPGAIARLDVIPDGGSAIYGSDAVAGVMNFITRKDIKGIEADAHYGIAGNYESIATDVSGGYDWGSGSAYVTYNYEQHGWIFGRDRDYVHIYPTKTSDSVLTSVTALVCSPGNVTASSGTIYALPALTAHTANQCQDQATESTLYPKEDRNSIMFGVSQDLSARVHFDVTGFFTYRSLRSVTGSFVTTLNMGPSYLASYGYLQSPYTASHSVSTMQSVAFKWGGDTANHQTTGLGTWGIIPTLTVDLGDTWQLRVDASYSESRNKNVRTDFNPTALNNAVNAGLFNPYDPLDSATNNAAAVAAIANYETYGYAKQELADFRVVADGDLFTLPGGAVKLAAGMEFEDDHYLAQTGVTVPGAENAGYSGLSINGKSIIQSFSALPRYNLRRTDASFFAELNIPVIGAENNLPLVEELVLTASARLDDYSDQGATFNPKFGFDYKPLDWVKFRGSWGRSFNAPSLADSAKATITQSQYLTGATAAYFAPPSGLGYPAYTSGQEILIIQGNSNSIHFQKARTLSIGTDITPPFIPGLDLGLTFWRIDLTGQIGIPPYYNPGTFYKNFGYLLTVNPTQAQITAAENLSQVTVTNGCSPASCVYAIIDARKTNLGDVKTDGLDMSATYDRDVSFGSIGLGAAGTYYSEFEQNSGPGSAWFSAIAANQTRFRGKLWVSAKIGDLTTRLTLNHVQGWKLVPAVGVIPQSSLGSFDTVDMFASYDLNGNDLVTRNLTLSLNISNLLDQDPPLYRQPNTSATNAGYWNGATLGRAFIISISKKI